MAGTRTDLKMYFNKFNGLKMLNKFCFDIVVIILCKCPQISPPLEGDMLELKSLSDDAFNYTFNYIMYIFIRAFNLHVEICIEVS